MPLELIKRHGSRNWYMRGTVRGVTVDKSTRTDSRDAADAIRIKEQARILDRSVHGERATVTFLEVAVLYMEGGGEARFMKPLINHFKTRKIAEIEQEDIDAAAKALYPGRSPATLNRHVYTPMSAVLALATRRKWSEARRFDRPRQPKGRIRWLTPAEADRLVECSATHLRPLVTFLLATGARLSEALYLQWHDVDLSRRHVSFTDTKSGEARGVPLHDRAFEALANLKHRVGPVFLKPNGKPYKEKQDGGGQIKTGFAGACRRARIKNFSPHDCRHTWATWHYMANRDLAALMLLGGWKSEAMVLRYAHVNVENLAGGIKAIAW